MAAGARIQNAQVIVDRRHSRIQFQGPFEVDDRLISTSAHDHQAAVPELSNRVFRVQLERPLEFAFAAFDVELEIQVDVSHRSVRFGELRVEAERRPGGVPGFLNLSPHGIDVG